MFNYKLKTLILTVVVNGVFISLFHTHHAHHEFESDEQYSNDIASTDQSISSDVNFCPTCIFFLKTDLLETTYNGVVFHSSKELDIPDEVFLPHAYEVLIKGRSPPFTNSAFNLITD
ncbi:MAG: hypothetical protein GVY07_04830 [Bacteroidetes bacterium]|jgi:hypothetical protein|nr:hypothetical protein [Bacteroidota bacterium]